MRRYYFDHNATTAVSPDVLEAMLPVMSETYGNASSIHHFGQAARQRLDEARRRVASLLGALPEEIVFTSGGTESDNLALLGTGGHAITTAVEHPAVLGAAAQMQDATVLPVDGRGMVDPDDVRRAIQPGTKIISVIHVNNELGVIQPVEEIAAIARDAGVGFHSDGVQAAGKMPLNMHRLGVNLYSVAAHKFYGPKGIGALYVRKGTALRPLLYGGHHERDRRAGTENVAGAVGMGRAALAALEGGEAETQRLQSLRDGMERKILALVPGARINGEGAPRICNTSNLRFEGIDSEPLLIALDLRGFAISSGSACSSGATEPSHVLTAIGLSKQQARSSVRISLGRGNDQQQVDELVEALAESVAHLRKLAPAYV